MRELVTTFVLLLAVALLRPASAPAVEYGPAGAGNSLNAGRSSGAGDTGRHGKLGPFTGSGRKSFLQMAAAAPPGPDWLSSTDRLRMFGADAGASRDYPADPGLFDDVGIHGADDLKHGIGSSARPDVLLAPFPHVHSRTPFGAYSAGADGNEKWFRMPAINPIPEPGTAGMLIAGLLGICAVARRRIFPT